MLFRTIRGSLPSTTLRSPYRVSPKIQTERPSGNGMEYAASAPHHDCLKGKLGVQSALTFSCPCSSVTLKNRNDAIKITSGLIHRAHNPCTDIYYTSRSMLFADQNQCSAGEGIFL